MLSNEEFRQELSLRILANALIPEEKLDTCSRELRNNIGYQVADIVDDLVNGVMKFVENSE